MASRQNHITIRVRYSKTQQTITWRGVGTFGRINMSTLSHQMAAGSISGGVDRPSYWSAILELVAADARANA